MLKIAKFYARSFDLDHINVFWEPEELHASEDPIVYEFTLFKSESPGGPWTKIIGPFTNRYFYQDTTNPMQHKYRKIHFKLVVHSKRTNESDEYITSQIPEPDLIALEVIRRENMLFKKFAGRKCLIYPRKTIGARCGCYQKTAQRQSISNCMTCYSTGILGGYSSPFASYIQIDPSMKTEQPTMNVTYNPSQTTARLISFPPVNPKDIIIENENKRWIIVSVNTTEKFRSPLRQELSIKEILKSDPGYKLPVLEDIKNINDIVEERNFTNPQTIRNDTDESYTNKPRGTTL